MLPKIKTILFATGLEPDAPYVYRYALALAREHQAGIVAVHGMEPLSPFAQSLVERFVSHNASEHMHEQAREAVKAELQQQLEQLCTKECDTIGDCHSLTSSIRVEEGYPPQVILDIAEETSADLIVMGSHHHTMVGEILGSTTRKVLHGATQPVFVVKIPERKS